MKAGTASEQEANGKKAETRKRQGTVFSKVAEADPRAALPAWVVSAIAPWSAQAETLIANNVNAITTPDSGAASLYPSTAGGYINFPQL